MQYWSYEINSMQCTEGGVQAGGIYPYGPYLEIDNSWMYQENVRPMIKAPGLLG